MIGKRGALAGERNEVTFASGRFAGLAVLVAAGLAGSPAYAQRQPVNGGALSGPGLAAAVSGTPSVGEPGLGNDVPQGSPIPRILPPTLPGASPGAGLAAPAAPSPVPDVTLPIRAVTVAGATAYSATELERLTAGLTGPAVSQRQIEAARTAIVNRYRSDGFVFTAVSAFVADGTLRFVVTEGHVTDVQLDGDIGAAAAQVLRFLNHVTAARPIDTPTIERWLLLASDIPGINIRSVLRASTDDPGGLTLVAQVSRTPINGLAAADNRGFRQAGPEEMLAVVDFNSFTALGERTELSIFHTFNDTQTFGQASTEVFLGNSGLRLKVYGGAGDTTPSGVFRQIGYNGFTTIFGAQLSYPVIRERQQTLNLFADADALESDIRVAASAGVTSRLSYDSTRVLRIGANYARSDTWLGGDRGAVNAGLIRVSQGVPSFGATGNNASDAPRAGERTDFTKVDAEISRTQTLYQPWEAGVVSLVGTLAGQYSGDVLPPAEQFFLGGSRFNRGYYSGQVTGDRALAGSLELQLTTPLAWPGFIPRFDATAQFYAFYDYGEVWQSHAADANRTLNSVGTGARFFLTRYLELDVEGVARLTRYPNGGGSNISAEEGEALFWRAVTRF